MNVDRTRRNECGSALVEAALTMLTFLIIIFAIFEAGRMMSIQQTLTNAAREGARLSVLPLQGGTDTLPSDSVVRSRVRVFLDASGLNSTLVPDSNILVDKAYNPGGAGTPVFSLITVTAPYRIVSISMFSFLEVNLQGRAMMRNETNLK